MRTNPLVPSTVIVMPSRMVVVPTRVPTTAGRPNSRRTIAHHVVAWRAGFHGVADLVDIQEKHIVGLLEYASSDQSRTDFQAQLAESSDTHLVDPEAVVLGDTGVVLGSIHELVEARQFGG